MVIIFKLMGLSYVHLQLSIYSWFILCGQKYMYTEVKSDTPFHGYLFTFTVMLTVSCLCIYLLSNTELPSFLCIINSEIRLVRINLLNSAWYLSAHAFSTCRFSCSYCTVTATHSTYFRLKCFVDDALGWIPVWGLKIISQSLSCSS